MAAVYLIRHGQASFGKENYDKLSPLGEKQSYVLGEYFAKRGIEFDKVIHGGLVRHHQTAEHCINGFKEAKPDAPFDIDRRFSEYNHQEVIARHRPDLDNHHAMASYLTTQPSPQEAFQSLFVKAIERWTSGEFDHEYSESWQDFQQRCNDGLTEITAFDNAYKNVAIFTSGGPISMLMQQVLQLTNQQAINISWSLVNASITKLIFKDGHVSLSYFNDFGYFEQVDSNLITYR